MSALPSDMLGRLFTFMETVDLRNSQKVCQEWFRLVTLNAELWVDACERDFGLPEHHLASLSEPLRRWRATRSERGPGARDVYLFCHRSLWHHKPGIDAAWRAYRDSEDMTKNASPGRATYNVSTLRHFDDSMYDPHCDLQRLRVFYSSDTGDFVQEYPPVRVVQYSEASRVRALMAVDHVVLNGMDENEPTLVVNLSTEKPLPPLHDCWCSSRGNHTNVHFVVVLDRERLAPGHAHASTTAQKPETPDDRPPWQVRRS